MGEPIREIRVETNNVFDLDSPGESLPPFHWANAVHIRTKEKVIRRELLFSEGDPYDPDLLQETERNLRGLPFIRKAEVIGVETSSGPVVIVRTWDAWTLEVTASFSRAGGVNQTKAGIADGNVLGRGKTTSLLYQGSGPTVERSIAYSDPQLLDRHVRYDMLAGESSQARHYMLSIARPFYSSLTKSSFSGGGHYAEDRTTVYQGTSQAGTVGRRAYDADVTYGYALQASTRRTNRLTLGLVTDHADYSALPDATTLFVPDAEQHTALQLGLDYQELDFIKARRIQKLSREEDFNMGLAVSPSIGYAPPWQALGTTGARLTPKIEVRKGFSTELGQIVLLRGDYSSAYVNGGNGMRLATADLQYYCRYYPRHTVAAHLAFDHGWRLDEPSLLSLGEDTGLRGYRAGQFQGNRRLLMTAEDRIFLFDNLFKLVDGGAVVFFDSGYAWMPEQAFTFGDLKSSYGVGLRLAASRSSDNEPVRIDLAHALNDNNFPSRWTVSIQAGRAFGSN